LFGLYRIQVYSGFGLDSLYYIEFMKYAKGQLYNAMVIVDLL